LIKLLQSVEQVKVGVVGNTLPIEFQFIRVLGFIHQLAKEEINQFVKGVFPPGDIVLAQNRGELMVFFLLVGGGNTMQVGNGVFVLADMIGLDIVFKNPFGCVVKFVGIPPDSKALFSVRGISITFE
jgi:hypothetical protein